MLIGQLKWIHVRNEAQSDLRTKTDQLQDLMKQNTGALDEDGQDSLGAAWYKISELNKDMISPLTYNILKEKNLME